MAITAFAAGNKPGSRRASPEVGNNRFPMSEIQTGYRTRPRWGAGRWRLFLIAILLTSRLWQGAGWNTSRPPTILAWDWTRSAVFCPWRQTVRESKALDELKQQIPLLDYLQAHDWQQPGAYRLAAALMGLCPLHADHKPSFLVDPGQKPVLLLRLRVAAVM